MKLKIYKFNEKGLMASNSNEPTDRMIFTGPKTAICYNVETKELIEPFMNKSRDSFVVEVDEMLPQLKVTEEVDRQYRGKLDYERLIRDFGISRSLKTPQ